jgi:hypothetical protein
MPSEVGLLWDMPSPIDCCPRCHVPFVPFMRGEVQRSQRFLWVLWRRPYCAVICQACKEIVGWEEP